MFHGAIRSVAFLLCSAAIGTAGQFPVGSKIQEISVQDHGSPVSISPERAKVTVVVFVSTQCPISNSYNDRMAALYRDYSGKPVQFVFVNSNSNESVSAIDQHAKEHGFGFKVYKDADNVLADKYNAQATPETYVFDSSGTLVYHGHIDDAQNASRVQQQSLRKAMDAVLEGQPVPVAETKAFGCTIKRIKKTS